MDSFVGILLAAEGVFWERCEDGCYAEWKAERPNVEQRLRAIGINLKERSCAT